MGIEMAQMEFNVNCCWNKGFGFKDYSEKKVLKVEGSSKLKKKKKSKQISKVTDVDMEEPEEEELQLN